MDKEKRVKTASEEELVEIRKSKNPLIKLLEEQTDTMLEPEKQGNEEEEDEEQLVIRRRKGKKIVEEDDLTPKVDEEQVYVYMLDTFILINLVNFTLEGETRSVD